MSELDVPHLLESSYPLRRGNLLRPLIGGEPAFRRICEAAEAARHSVWVTVAFLGKDVELPDRRGHLFDVLDRAAARGLDVRALFWRSPEAGAAGEGDIFHGTEQDHELLRRRSAGFLARWDRLDKTYCHHQKTWLIDAGTERETTFVGGINLTRSSVTVHPFPARDAGHTQDIYCEVRGPAATDVHHNFVQRWNGASERGLDLGVWPSAELVGDLEFPHRESPEAGEVPVQITRTVRRGFYRDDTPTPGGKPFSIVEGDYAVYQQYLAAIDAAREALYFENQTFLAPEIVEAVERAVLRGVEVAALVPGQSSALVRAGLEAPHLAPTVERLVRLGERDNFALLALAASREPGAYDEVYVHTKAAIVDDRWATIGSTNIANRSFFGDTEMNASFWHPETVRSFRSELLSAHHGGDLGALDFPTSLRELRSRAVANRRRKGSGALLEGFTYALDLAAWSRGES